MAIWISSDLHLFHTKPFLYEPRGFDDVLNMNKTIIDNIIIYLNSILGAKFGLGTQSTRNLITKWLKTGFTEDDFKTVIDKKYAEWHNTNMEMYLRPSTLFGNKFEEYLNQKNSKSSNQPRDIFKELRDC